MKQIALYIHIPFCIKKCNYCDFNSFDTLELIPMYLKSLKREIFSLKGLGHTATTVFIGGGTPTILKSSQLESILKTLHDCIDIANNAEFTIEANPGTLTRQKLLLLKSMGVNRLSIGLQAYQNRLLKIMGRIHTAEEFDKSYETARNIGFDNINVDLIFGLPRQSTKDFETTLKHVLRLSPEHISCYSLSVEEGTKFYRWMQEGSLSLPTDEEERKMYHRAREVLTEQGYNHYEISNFSIAGRESKHNLVYWTYKDYLGLGAGAHSFFDNKRFYNHKTIPAYIKSIYESSGHVAHVGQIPFKEQLSEFCFLSLRLIQGLSKEAFRKRFSLELNQVYGNVIEKLKKQGLLQENAEYIKLTTQGLDFANEVFMEFLP
ncbi:MAG TPA: oxygen-independent coproporphyrinogen III oxidase [Thermoanaerobacterales bacterium]|nr:oxygen-independent coproporphyrinogen III oxidase [Thermoanaerobacterales bacterium]